MKIVYFDTSAYNKIVEHPKHKSMIQSFGKVIESGILEIIFSPLNFEEFLHTVQIDKRTQLFELAHSICSNSFFIDHKELLRKELVASLEGNSLDRKDLFQEENDQKNTLQEAIDGSLFKDIPIDPFKEMKNRKYDYLASEKKSKNELKPLWKEYNNIKFEEFYMETLQNIQGKAMLKDICIRAIGNKINEEALSEINLEKLPGLRFLSKYICASIYKPLIEDKKPKWGSGIDMNHSVFIGHSDIFVTGDEDFLDIVRSFREPQTDCLVLNDFIKQYIQINQ